MDSISVDGWISMGIDGLAMGWISLALIDAVSVRAKKITATTRLLRIHLERKEKEHSFEAPVELLNVDLYAP